MTQATAVTQAGCRRCRRRAFGRRRRPSRDDACCSISALRAAHRRYGYDVASGTLRSTDRANGDAPSPLVSNVVNLKFQYGIDSDGDGMLDTWVRAEPPGGW